MAWRTAARYALFAVAGLTLVGGVAWLVGTRLPSSHRATVEFTLAQPPDSVFAVITDVRAAPGWRSDLQSVSIESNDDEALRWSETTSFGLLHFVVEEAAPQRRLRVRIEDPDQQFGGTWTYVLQQAGAGTRVTITEDGEVYNPLFRVLSRYVFGHYGTLERYGRDLGRRFGEEPRVARTRM